jgi:hypothetical protein
MVGCCGGHFLNEKMYLLFTLFLKCNDICGKYIGITLVQFQMLFKLLHTLLQKHHKMNYLICCMTFAYLYTMCSTWIN